ncbi:MAG: hypothetical protein D3923_06330, partial [Candidatus Electrothrix sp. AR3]|nr:hypothetical protein [Candidatus Electrothrix sp. AR3]
MVLGKAACEPPPGICMPCCGYKERKYLIMSIQYKIFTVRPEYSSEDEEQLNLFLRSHKVLTVHQEFVADGMRSCWHFSVEFFAGQIGEKNTTRDGRKQIDYKELLDPQVFTLYAQLREWRKQIADQEAVPLYTIFTNKQLAQIAEERINTKESLRKIEGVGAARIDKYGTALIEFVKSADK